MPAVPRDARWIPEESMREEGISVVTPTFGQAHLVAQLVESVVASGTASTAPWEHILVDSSTGAQARAIAELCRRHGATYLRGPDRVGAKRNVGARAARHPVVLFIDSDCRATRPLLAQMLASFTGDDVAAVAGPTDMDGPAARFAHRVLRRAKQYNHCFAWPRIYTEMGWSTTSNLAVRRDVLLRLGGFNEETLTVVGGEDVDLGVRIRMAGDRIVTNEHAVVVHTRTMSASLARVGRRVFVYGQADGWLCRRHPGLRAWNANPFVISPAVWVLALLADLPVPLVAAAGPLTLALLVAVEAGRRHERGSGLRGTVEDSLCTMIDYCFDAGEVWAALRTGHLTNAVRRFRYVQQEWFRPR